MTFPKVHNDGEVWNGAAVTDLEARAFAAMSTGVYVQPTTDDAPGINSQLAAQGWVDLGGYSYHAGSTITIGSGQAIWGRGQNSTRITALSGANCDMIQTTNFSSLTGTNNPGGATDVWTLNGMTLDGNKTNNTSGRGISSYAIAPEISNVTVRNFAGQGMWWEGPSTDPGDSGRNHHIHDIRVYHNNGTGVTITASDSFMDLFTVFQNGTIFGDPNVTQVNVVSGITKLSNGHIWAGDSQYNLIVHNAECHVNNCEVEGAPNTVGNGNVSASVAVFGNGFVMTNCYLIGNNLTDAHAFQFGNGTDATFIAECSISDVIMEGFKGGICASWGEGPHTSHIQLVCFSPTKGQMTVDCGTTFPSDSVMDLIETNAGGTFYYQNPGAASSVSHGYTSFLNTTGSWTVPAGITAARMRGISAAGGGAGGGSTNSASIGQVGGSGGMGGEVVDQTFAVTPGQVLNVTAISTGGTGGGGGSSGGNPGVDGNAPSGTTTVTYPPANVIMNLGWNFNQAFHSNANVSTPPAHGTYATNLTNSATSPAPGEGASTNFGGQPHYGCIVGGGAGGQAASASGLGGTGGRAQQTVGGGVYLTGMAGGTLGGSGTADGGTGQTATQPGCGGGGGGGAANGGTGGTGGGGGPTLLEVWY
jgi:hypothetical protein